MSTGELIDSLRELVENAPSDDISLPADLEELPKIDDLDAAWEEVGSLHRRIDRLREGGEISAERAGEFRSLAVELSREIADRAVTEEGRRYSALLRDVSHDIRSPLHSIIFLAEALYSGRSGSLDDDDRRQVGTIYAASTSLLNLVNDLLDYARMDTGEAGEIEETTFSADSVVSEVRHLLAPLVEYYDTEYEIRLPEGVRFRGDSQLVARLLTNLVSNAIEAAGQGGEVDVTVEPRDGGLGIEVVDDGDEADIDQIECLISQPRGETIADCVGEKRQGRSHGLGLLICGRLLNAAGGRSRVERLQPESENDPGDGRDGGTRVRVWLPFPRVEEGG